MFTDATLSDTVTDIVKTTYTIAMVIDERKTQVVNLRMRPAVKELLRVAAERDHRTLSNLLEVLILEHCRRNDIQPAEPAPQKAKRGTRARAK